MSKPVLGGIPEATKEQSQSLGSGHQSLRERTAMFFKNREFKHGIMLVATPETFGLLAKRSC